MRENTKWIMLITAAAFVALMVFEWGMDMSGQSAAAMTGGELGQVNGEPITYQQWNQVYRNLYEQRQEEQSGAMTSEDNDAIEDEAWNQIVMDRLIDQELRRRGIETTESEIRQAARYSPPPEFYQYEIFQTDGQFDLDKYHEFLSSASADPRLLQDLEGYYRRMIPRNKLFQQVAAAVVVTEGELWRQYREQTETASMDYVLLDPQRLVSDSQVTVTDAEIAEYYNQHREDFERPARAEVRMVAVDKAPTAADTAAALERAQQAWAEIQGGADFADVALRESDDPASAEEGGSLGTVGRGQTAPAFEEAVWSAPIGQVMEPIHSQFGYHVIRVDRRTDEEADVAHILFELRRTLESEDTMLATVDSLEDQVERMSLEAAAEGLELQVRTVEVNPDVPSVPGIGSVSEGVDWIFGQRPLPDAVSPIFENDRYYYVMELVDREETRQLTLEEATPNIRTLLHTERKRERTRDTGRQLVDRIQAGATLEEAAEQTGLTVRSAGPFTRLQFVPGVGSGNTAIGAAFGLPVGEISGLLETSDAFYVIRVTDRTEADREAWLEQLPQQRQQVTQTLQNQRLNQFLEALREEANIVDNRDAVLNAPADAQQPPPSSGLF
ncbi:MAG: peptidylprolyl isomerase [Longimicrobiales bacterium]